VKAAQVQVRHEVAEAIQAAQAEPAPSTQAESPQISETSQAPVAAGEIEVPAEAQTQREEAKAIEVEAAPQAAVEAESAPNALEKSGQASEATEASAAAEEVEAQAEDRAQPEPTSSADASRETAVGERGTPRARRDHGQERGARRAVEADASPQLKTNWRITDELDRRSFSPTERMDANLEALRIIQHSAAEDTTVAQAQLLAKWVGWGGLSRYFEEDKLTSAPDRARAAALQELLADPADYHAASDSTLNAHYTSKEAVEALWQAAMALGFSGGKVLEPGAGVGNFLGLVPASIATKTEFTAVEKDPLTAEILRRLYPQATVHALSFEDVPRREGPFDLVIGNVPFAETHPYDAAFRAEPRYTLHDYFFRKGISLLKAGGVMVALTSTGTLDKKDSAARRELLRHAELVGAARLPSDAMRAVANTDVVTDVLAFAKRPEPLDDEQLERAVAEAGWIEVRDYRIEAPSGQTLVDHINTWFDNHPESLLGGTLEQANMQAGRLTIGVRGADDWQERLKAWARSLDVHAPRLTAERAEADHQAKQNEALDRPFDRHDVDGRIDSKDGVWTVVERRNGMLVRTLLQLSTPEIAALTPALRLRDAVLRLTDLELEDAPDAEIEALRTEINDIYDGEFAKKRLSERRWPRVFQEDPWYGRFIALEREDSETKELVKADIFSKRTSIRAPSYPDRVDTAEEALFIVLAQIGRIDIERIGALAGMEPEAARAELLASQRVFRTPEGGLEIAAKYLSGDVREKHREAVAAFQAGDEAMAVNVERLADIIPESIPAEGISVQLGTVWIKPEEIRQFVTDALGYSAWDGIEISYSAILGEWNVRHSNPRPRNIDENTKYSTERIGALEVLEHALAGRTPRIMDEIGEGQRVLNAPQTLLANERLTAMQERFQKWVFYENANRQEEMVKRYNERFNSYVPPTYDGSFLKFPGMNTEIALRAPQRNAVARALFDRRVGLAHMVGVGKTFTQIAIAHEWKRLGIFNKPVIIVKNNMLDQFANEAQQLYPGARIAVIRKEDLTAANRAKFVGKIANNDWDYVICTHAVFGRIGVSRETQVAFLEKELDTWREAVKEMVGQEKAGGRMRGRSVAKRIARMVETKEAKLKALHHEIAENQDDGVTFEALGLDAVIVDESHKFKNGGVAIPGRDLALTESQRAVDLQMKLDWLEGRHGERAGIVLASGTPISNHVLELYVLHRYLLPDILGNLGLDTASAWVSNFVGAKAQWEPSTTGDGFVLKERPFFINAQELLRITRHVVDTATPDDANLKLPTANSETVTCTMSPNQEAVMLDIMQRAKAVKNREVKPEEDNMLKIVSDGRKVSLDPRLLDTGLRSSLGLEDLEDWQESKANNIVQKGLDHYRKSADIRGAQLIFLDLGVHEKHGYSLYADLKRKLIAAGIPESEIAFIHDADSDAEKEELSEKVRNGFIRFLLGSTEKMGEGTNFQDRLVAIHHGDAPWRPSDIEQRNGRAIRQGNMSGTVGIYYYVAKGSEGSQVKGSLDAFMYAVLDTKWRAFSKFVFGSIEECDRIISMDADSSISYGEIVAAASGDERIKRKFTLEAEVQKLKRLESADRSEKFSLKGRMASDLSRINTMRDDLADIEKIVQSATSLQEKAPPILATPDEDGQYKWLVVGHQTEKGEQIVLPREDAVRAVRRALLHDSKKPSLSESENMFSPEDVTTDEDEGSPESKKEAKGKKKDVLPPSGFVRLLYRGVRVLARVERDLSSRDTGDVYWSVESQSGERFSRTRQNTELVAFVHGILDGGHQKSLHEEIARREHDVSKYKEIITQPFPRAEELRMLSEELESLTADIEKAELATVESQTVTEEPVTLVDDEDLENQLEQLAMGPGA
jgi:N12 class adenine-specific DNA methylase